jgi:CRP-like cAMP-binding protein
VGGVTEKIGYLSKMDLFQGLTAAEMQWLEKVTTMITCKKGQVVYAPGETGEVLFLLKKGRIQIYRLSPEGKKLVIATLSEDTFFGEMSLIGQGLYDSFAEAIEDSTVCAMSRSDIEGLITSHPQVALQVLHVVGQRLLNMETILEEMTFKPVAARLASLLLRLAADQGTSVIAGLTHQDLAEMTGTFRETVTETLNQFKAQGLVDLHRMQITILDSAQLAHVAEGRHLRD